MVMQTLAKSGTTLKIFTFGLLVLATVGLVMMDVGGFFRNGGVSSSDVAKVGNENISLSYFDRNLRRTLGRIGLQPAEAYKMGYVDQFLASEMRSRMLDQIAEAHDVNISRKHVAQEVQKMIEPIAQGNDTKTVLKQILNAQGVTEYEFTDAIRREMASSLIAMSIQNGFAKISDELAQDLYLGQNEMRDVSYLVFSDKDVKDIPEPGEEQIKELYEMTKEKYAILETRVLQIIKIKDESVKKTLEITDEELKASYEDNIDAFTTLASHRIEQIVVSSEETAKKIHDDVKGGKSLKQAAQDAGQLSSYMGSQDVVDSKTPAEFKNTLPASKEGDLIGPTKSPIGYHVIKVVKILPETVRPFEEVKKEIKDEMYQNKLADQRYALANEVDDMLAGGATPEEVAEKIDVEITSLPAVNSFGQDAGKKDALKSYEQVGASILETGFGLSDGETSPVSEMADGSFMAVHVKSITPKTYTPFEDVKKEIENNWRADQAAASNRVKALAFISQIGSGQKTLEQVASETAQQVRTLKGLTRKTEAPKPMTDAAMQTIFGASSKQPVFIGTQEGFGIAVVSQIRWPEKINPSGDEFKKFKADLEKNTQGEALATYLENKSKTYKAVVNNELLRQAYTPRSQDDGSIQ